MKGLFEADGELQDLSQLASHPTGQRSAALTANVEGADIVNTQRTTPTRKASNRTPAEVDESRTLNMDVEPGKTRGIRSRTCKGAGQLR
jgi:hypothetical protein